MAVVFVFVFVFGRQRQAWQHIVGGVAGGDVFAHRRALARQPLAFGAQQALGAAALAAARAVQILAAEAVQLGDEAQPGGAADAVAVLVEAVPRLVAGEAGEWVAGGRAAKAGRACGARALHRLQAPHGALAGSDAVDAEAGEVAHEHVGKVAAHDGAYGVPEGLPVRSVLTAAVGGVVGLGTARGASLLVLVAKLRHVCLWVFVCVCVKKQN